MKLIFDMDGTLTDFNKFVKDNAYDYFEKEYGMKIVYPEKLEVEDIFDMDNFFMQKYNCSKDEAQKHTKKALDKFWVNASRFIKFSLLGKFRNGVSDFIKYCQKMGYNIEIHSSRAKTTDDNIVGEICRKFTYLQYLFNGIKLDKSSFYFYENDKEKLENILKRNPDVVFEDKSDIILELSKNNINTICVNGTHNKDIIENNNIRRISDYNIDEIEKIFDEFLGKKNYSIKKRISNSELMYKKVRIVIPYIMNKFNPIILNYDNLKELDDSSVIIAPNHRSTLDPLIINSILDKPIHWAALKRFFDGKDSIFNNSKNPILCKITSEGFKKLEYFPIERKKDNPKANNLTAIKDMNAFLKNNQYIGIFPEGTTSRPENCDFGTFDPTFLNLAKKSDAWILPITILWIKELEIKNKVLINFAKPFKINEKNIDEVYTQYVETQKNALKENESYRDDLKNKPKKLIKNNYN